MARPRRKASNSKPEQDNTKYGATGTPSDVPTRKNIQPEEDGTTLTQPHSEHDFHLSGSVSFTLPQQSDIATGGDVDRTAKAFSSETNGDDIATDTTDHVHTEKYLDTDIRPSGAVKKEKTLVTEESQEPDSSGQVVSAQKDTSLFPNLVLNTERSNGTRPPVYTKGTGEEHQKRLIPKNTCQGCKGGFHPANRHDFVSHLHGRDILWRECRQKVGLVRCQQCGDLGTCFRIGRQSVVTCNHVISKCTCKGHDVTADFFYQEAKQQSTISYRMSEKQIHKELDFAILELCDNGTGYFPPASTKFRGSDPTAGSEEHLVYLVCFQKDRLTGESNLVVNCETVRLNNNIFDNHLYDSNLKLMEKFPTIKGPHYGQPHMHKEVGSVPLISDVTHGGSGGVGICVDQSGHFVVEFMYRRGYPGFYYNTNGETALSKEKRDELSICWRMEIGVDIRTIIEHTQPEHWECDEHVSC